MHENTLRFHPNRKGPTCIPLSFLIQTLPTKLPLCFCNKFQQILQPAQRIHKPINSMNHSTDNIRGNSPTTNYTIIKPNRANQATGALVLLALFGTFWIYGFGGEIRNAATAGSPTTGINTLPMPNTQTLLGDLYIVSTIFVVLGFGLVLTYFKKGTASALFTVLFIVSYTAILSPILQKFWFNVFITNFQGAAPTASDPSRLYKYSLGGLFVYLDFYNLRIALANAIGQLIVIIGLMGRLSLAQVVLHSTLFNFCWNLNHFLCVLLSTNSPDSRFFDDYQITSVHLFSATYGLVLIVLLKGPPIAHTPSFSSSQKSVILAHLGTFFLFLGFTVSTTIFALKNTRAAFNESSRSLIWQQAFISIFFALSASVIANYATQIVINPRCKIGIRGSLLGTITGAIMYGSVAGTSINIGAAIAVGLIAGSLSAFFYEKVYPKVNGDSIKDALGMGIIWVVAFLGTFVVAPIVLRTYYNYQVDLPTLYPQNDPTGSFIISNKDVAGWSLVYVAISVGIGLLAGILIGLLLKALEKVKINNFDDSEYFKSSSYGLREIRSGSIKYLDHADPATKDHHHHQHSAEIIIT